MKKKVDPRIRQTLQDAVANNHRAIMLLVGDKSRDQVVNLHYILSKMSVTARPTVLWCYKKELGFSSSKKKRMKVIKKRIKQGLVDPSKDDPFELFISATTIRFAYYSESHKILGNTYGMCVLQDFEALTPNLLARTLETVQGGGLIVILIHNMTSLKQLFSLSMDVHSRLRTEAHSTVVPRFNERFILSLADCPAAIVADDELNILPISSHVRALSGHASSAGAATIGTRMAPAAVIGKSTADASELVDLKKSLEDTQPVGPLVAQSRTIDQAKALLRFEEALSEKTLRTTVALTASRGRGKSAALGLAVAAAVAHDYSNIFVTSPSPENLRTFFAFVFVGFDALSLQEHTDYEIIQSTDAGLNKAVVRVNIFKSHRQTIQYVDPTDAPRFLSQAELLVIDEAAAIPLPLVESMLGPYVVFMSSTVTGYEGTGRSLSLKLIKKLREGGSSGRNDSSIKATGQAMREVDREASAIAARSGSGRLFYEVHMETPIRYSENDPVEAWLYDLLCLKAGGTRQVLTAGAPHPNECELYYVERDALFSRHRASEAFLQRVIALFVSSHYKNSPNDLQMLSDAPAHALFVLLAPTRADSDTLPDVLVAIQVCLEGRISSKSSKAQLSRGQRASGDLIPWTVSQQFQEPDFASLSGARIVRVATHPDLQGMGYGTRAMELLMNFYAGKIISLDNEERLPDQNEDAVGNDANHTTGEDKVSNLLNEVIGPRKNIPPLLRRLHERRPEKLDYLGVSFGLTHNLYNFWNGKLRFLPLYLRLTPNELTGEHTCIMATCVSPNQSEDAEVPSWLDKFHQDFRRRLVYLLGYELRKFSSSVATAILEQRDGFWETDEGRKFSKSDADVKTAFNAYDGRRLESYARNLVDYHMILDMVPKLAELHAMGAFEGDDTVHLSAAQKAILISIGLQRKGVDEVAGDLRIEANQVLALLNKVIRKFAKHLRDREEAEAARNIGQEDVRDRLQKHVLINRNNRDDNTHENDDQDNSDVNEFNEEGDDAVSDTDEDGSPKKEGNDVQDEEGEMVVKSGKEPDSAGLTKFKIEGSEKEWREALAGTENGAMPTTVSVKAWKRKSENSTRNEQSASKKKKRRKP